MPDASGSDVFARLGISVRDLAETDKLNEEQARGEFILQNERPTTKKLLAYELKKAVSAGAEERRKEYGAIFERLGMRSELSERFQRHLAKIHAASLETELAIQQVMDARQSYDREVKNVLGVSRYEDYRRFESSRPALHEIEQVRMAAQQRGVQFDPAIENALVEIFSSSGARSTVSWHGPYDGLPDGVLGEENVIHQLSARQSELAARLDLVMNLCERSDLPKAARSVVSSYFVGKLQEMERVKEALQSQIRPEVKP